MNKIKESILSKFNYNEEDRLYYFKNLTNTEIFNLFDKFNYELLSTYCKIDDINNVNKYIEYSIINDDYLLSKVLEIKYLMKMNHIFSININGILEEIFNYDTGLFYYILNTPSDITLRQIKINNTSFELDYDFLLIMDCINNATPKK